MNYSACKRYLVTLGLFLSTVFVVGLQSEVGYGQEKPLGKAMAKSPSDASGGGAVDEDADRMFVFTFDRTPWRDVIRWLADSTDLALQYEELPTGSFTYSDKRQYSQQEAINRVNLFLLPQGFTLIRTGSLLSVINLGDPRSKLQLDTLAELVSLDDLDNLESHAVVKCLFPLTELSPEDAVEELSVLNLMLTPAILSKTEQLMIIDTVAKLKSVRTILETFKPTTLANGTAMKSFALKHASAEDILQVARPHLGLATDENIGIDVSISTDPKGEHLFVTGVEDKIELIEGLVTALDAPAEKLTAEGSTAVLKTHRVAGGNIENVYNVLQTLLAGKTLRLSMDEEADNIVALASEEIQAEIAATVESMSAEQAEFEVVPLKTIDPVFAISLLDEMLDIPSEYDDVDEDELANAPKIDADPGNMRLFVRGKRHQIDEIKKIILGLDADAAGTSEDGNPSNIRLLPARGRAAIDSVEAAAKFWKAGNPIIVIPSEATTSKRETERVVADEAVYETHSKLVAAKKKARSKERFLTEDFDPNEPPIHCQVTPRGLLLESADSEALDLLEGQVRAIIGPGTATPSPPIVFYLKFTKPAEAITMLAELLDGGESAKEGTAGTLVNGTVSSFSFLGSIVTSRDGTMTMSADSVTVVADPRLNRLIAQGTQEDIERIEEYLEIIDKSNSITSVEVYGRSHVIELAHTNAAEVAEVLQSAYAGRLADSKSSSSAGKQSAPQREPEKGEKSSKGAKAPAKPTGSAAAEILEPKMTIAVHEASNSLIVTAPDQLFGEVQELVDTLDRRSEQTMEVVAGGSATISTLLGGADGSRSRESRSSNNSNRSSSRPSMSELLRSRFGK
ncbi:MAG: secretin N-terminal domain-containing protein [Aureliella sp.]